MLPIILLVSLVLTVQALAATRTVGPDGFDDGLAQTRAGDTLYLKGGTYHYINPERQTIHSGTSWSNAVTIACAPGETCWFRGQVNGNQIGFNSGDYQYIIFDRLNLDGGTPSTPQDCYAVLGGPHHIRFQQSEVTNCSGQGVIIGAGSHSLEFLGLKVHGNGQYDLAKYHGFYMGGRNLLIADSEIYNNAGYGIQLYAESEALRSDGSIIRQNRIYGNMGQGGITVHRATGVIVCGNDVSRNKYGISVAANAPDTKVYNNVVTNNQVHGIDISPGAANVVLSGNTVSGNGADQVHNEAGATVSSSRVGDAGCAASPPVVVKLPRPRAFRVVPR